MRRSDGIVAVGHDAVLCDALTFVFEYSYSSFFNIIEAFIRVIVAGGYIFECRKINK